MKSKILSLVLFVLTIVSVKQATAAECTAEIKPGKAPYPGVKTGVKISFWGYDISIDPNNAKEKRLYGPRMLQVPEKDLQNLSQGCKYLKKVTIGCEKHNILDHMQIPKGGNSRLRKA